MTDFVLVSVLLVALFLMVFQVGLLFHVRTVIASSAAEGARYGAAANRTPAQGAARAQLAVRQALGAEHGDLAAFLPMPRGGRCILGDR